MKSLLERIASGDQNAVELCIQEYGGLIYRLASRHLDHAQDEIEDAVQNVFIELWTSAKRYDSQKGSEPAFVATVAHRRLIDHQRRVTSRRRTIRKATPTMLNQADNQHNTQTATDHAPASLSKAFDSLPESEREALRMSLYGGLTHIEIGIATDAPIGTVKSRIRRAMIRLRESFELCPQDSTMSLCNGGES